MIATFLGAIAVGKWPRSSDASVEQKLLFTRNNTMCLWNPEKPRPCSNNESFSAAAHCASGCPAENKLPALPSSAAQLFLRHAHNRSYATYRKSEPVSAAVPKHTRARIDRFQALLSMHKKTPRQKWPKSNAGYQDLIF